MTVEFLVFPQWQGSGSSRAMRLSEGAQLIAGELPHTQSHFVSVLHEAGDSVGTSVRRVSSLKHSRDSARNILAQLNSSVVTIGGDCSSDLAGAEHALDKYGPENVALIWCDAHGDFNTPETSASGAFSGMVLRALTGEGISHLLPRTPALPRNIILVGGRDYDDEELAAVEAAGITMLSPVDLEETDALSTAVAKTGASHAYVHIDLDVLDPAECASVHSPVPFGLSVSQLSEAIRSVWTVADLAGGGICEFAPADEESASDDLTTVLRLIAAITA